MAKCNEMRCLLLKATQSGSAETSGVIPFLGSRTGMTILLWVLGHLRIEGYEDVDVWVWTPFCLTCIKYPILFYNNWPQRKSVHIAKRAWKIRPTTIRPCRIRLIVFFTVLASLWWQVWLYRDMEHIICIFFPKMKTWSPHSGLTHVMFAATGPTLMKFVFH